ncbi:MAG: GNAT family N-acetyltransferase [Microbacteriaceae bacterium]|nr:GNAT family N-acetyltransferase [Microbacteriaceae bacterium]
MSHRALSSGQFSVQYKGLTSEHPWGNGDPAHHFEAVINGETAGFALFNPRGDSSVLDMIHVYDPHRRKGVGTALWKSAEAQGINPTMSAERTNLGEVFAKSLGVPVPKRDAEMTFGDVPLEEDTRIKKRR